ncbi:MAG: alpha-E domain-containing protein, partial [Paracoccaceae bacterium]
KIAHFLILNPQMPRSLLTAVGGAAEHLDRLSRGYGHTGAPQELARGLTGALLDADIDTIFDEGLHEFLTRFIGEIARLGGAVYESYLSGDIR